MKPLRLALLAIASPAAMAAQELTTTTVLMGRVVARGGAPLPHAAITLNGRNPQFTDSLGRFQVEGIAAGSITVRARRVGWSPAEQIVRISRGDTARFSVQMERLAIALPAVVAPPAACASPGAPGRDAPSGLAPLYEALVQNAETFRLLSLAHPYVSAIQRQYVTTLRDSVTDRTPLEELRVASERSWKYEAGNLVAGGDANAFRLPTLGALAEDSFARAHCFTFGGMAQVDGQSLARVDFAPDARLRESDVSGSAYLDPSTWLIRKLEVRLSQVPAAAAARISGHSVTTWLAEAAPGIPVVGAVRSEFVRARDRATVTEMQQVVQVHFVNGRPGER